jgi:hypothetical protein
MRRTPWPQAWLGLGLLALACAPIAGMLLRVWTQGGYVAGGDGLLVLDQMQYVNWLRQAGSHVLIENLYDLEPGPRTFLHPGLLVSGGLSALGLHPAAAYLVWKPVAALALWHGASRWCARFLPAGRTRWAAVCLTLFFASPLAALVGWSGLGGQELRFQFDFLSGEIATSNYLWGYLFTAIAVGLMPLGLLAYERGSWRWAAVAGLIVSWLQPWQGATYVLVVGGAEAWRRRHGRGAPLDSAVAVGAATVAPLVYYLVLSRTDASWELAGRANDFGTWPAWVMVVGLSLLVVPALTGLRAAASDFGGTALRLWPVAALVVYLQPFGTFPAHALQGVALPLVTLGFLGVLGRFGVAALAATLVLLIVPGTLYRVDALRDAVNRGRQPFFLTDGEHAALRWLDRSSAPGGVLAPVYSGLLVPAHAQRETWVGAGSWTPDFDARVQRVERLFAGALPRVEAERVVRASGARFVLSDCHGRADVARLLARVALPPRRFGCATVWEVRR